MIKIIKRRTVLGYLISTETSLRYCGYEIILGGNVPFSNQEIKRIEKDLIEKKDTGDFDNSEEYMKIVEALTAIQKINID